MAGVSEQRVVQQRAERPVAVSATISPAVVLDALRVGLVVVPNAGPIWTRAAALRYRDGVADGSIAVLPAGADPGFDFTWWSPDPRFVIPAGAAKVNKKLRTLLRRSDWHSTVDTAFAAVVQECRRDREPRWITDDYLAVLTDLHRHGSAYSVEIWEGTELIAGGFGLVTGRTVSMDSHFYRREGASKICLIEAARRSTEAGAHLLDLQWPTSHGRDVGGREVPLAILTAASSADGRVTLPADRRPTTWLLPPSDEGRR